MKMESRVIVDQNCHGETYATSSYRACISTSVQLSATCVHAHGVLLVIPRNCAHIARHAPKVDGS